MPQLPNHHRTLLKWAIACLAALQLTACVQRVFFPVAVEELEVSPVYRLEVVNQTSQPLTFIPIRKFRQHHRPRQVPPGERIGCLLQVSRIKVGESVSREIVAGPFIDSGRLGPDLAHIQYADRRDIRRDIVIDIGHPSWFAPYAVSRTDGRWLPRVITIALTDETLDRTKWFAMGPDAP